MNTKCTKARNRLLFWWPESWVSPEVPLEIPTVSVLSDIAECTGVAVYSTVHCVVLVPTYSLFAPRVGHRLAHWLCLYTCVSLGCVRNHKGRSSVPLSGLLASRSLGPKISSVMSTAVLCLGIQKNIGSVFRKQRASRHLTFCCVDIPYCVQHNSRSRRMMGNSTWHISKPQNILYIIPRKLYLASGRLLYSQRGCLTPLKKLHCLTFSKLA